jgi:hypothetical protein
MDRGVEEIKLFDLIMRLCEAPFSSNLAPAISVRSEPAENERKKKLLQGRSYSNKKFFGAVLDHYELFFQKMVFGTNGF